METPSEVFLCPAGPGWGLEAHVADASELGATFTNPGHPHPQPLRGFSCL